MTLLPLPHAQPLVHETAYLAPGSFVIGAAEVGPAASIWFNAVVRADADTISIGEGSNLQDLVTAHADPGRPLRVGSNVSVGHGAVLHGCVIEDDVLVGMNATVLNGAVIGSGSIVAANALVPEGTVVPPRSLVAGVPAKVRRELGEDEVELIRLNAEHYRHLAQTYRAPTG
ncbi:gamma carbonic anhydrase family protein [Nocardioides sp. BP30]|uniref:gamma carbonic anhydrase family protein n=1 Tax=Nocardioides sp. BP30 TaxID=3036374 RepID=UPI002469889F|nr:gamma carbonic anhydrase family protein [Nocardioides sp. BP30]WGL50751.1 gamma carbonic anhydrase family protein [Nocardioides sp. BP30]